MEYRSAEMYQLYVLLYEGLHICLFFKWLVLKLPGSGLLVVVPVVFKFREIARTFFNF